MEVHTWTKVAHRPGNAALAWLKTYPSDSDSGLQPLLMLDKSGLTVKMLKSKWDEKDPLYSL